jgi:hypothetical protein
MATTIRRNVKMRDQSAHDKANNIGNDSDSSYIGFDDRLRCRGPNGGESTYDVSLKGSAQAAKAFAAACNS